MMMRVKTKKMMVCDLIFKNSCAESTHTSLLTIVPSPAELVRNLVKTVTVRHFINILVSASVNRT